LTAAGCPESAITFLCHRLSPIDYETAIAPAIIAA
jgi:hypothetical protein